MSLPSTSTATHDIHSINAMDSTTVRCNVQETGDERRTESLHQATQYINGNGNDAKMTQKKDKDFEEASAVVARHVKLLREYNEMKDAAQQLMGMVAEKRGVTVGSLYETGEFGVGPKD
ncbi:Putative DNA repair protein, Swi5 [Colletotrichum destructivum]|uniref:DNA repair protein, Swi5 n=1 Tax=Colletotrichum destructivum TaxID=34406 RepID=A0AAX4J3E5_9PEZI|nr:Putative DNA repair protein, Swi5 [Colletotrichum destructivum]